MKQIDSDESTVGKLRKWVEGRQKYAVGQVQFRVPRMNYNLGVLTKFFMHGSIEEHNGVFTLNYATTQMHM